MKTLTCISTITRDGLKDYDLVPGARYSIVDRPHSTAGEYVTIRPYGSRGPDMDRPMYLFRPYSPQPPKPIAWRPIASIAREISSHWFPVAQAAVPYLGEMLRVRTLYDLCGLTGHETGRMAVERFLANASTWRGQAARRIKRELNAHLKGKVRPPVQTQSVLKEWESEQVAKKPLLDSIAMDLVAARVLLHRWVNANDNGAGMTSVHHDTQTFLDK
jgi:hypothetical protein